MKETFVTIPGFKDYTVSNCGRVKTKSRKIRYTHAKTNAEHYRLSQERFLKVHFNAFTGYRFYQLYKDKKMHNVTVHKLVATAFCKHLKRHDTVNHIDGNKLNNRADNLEWCTNAYNHEHATKNGLKAKGSEIGGSKLNERCVMAIKYLLKLGVSHPDLGKAFRVSRPTISLISQSRTWKHALTGKELEIK